MVSKRKPSKTFPREFKLEALRQLEAGTRPATELARELGIRANQLYKWREQQVQLKEPPPACPLRSIQFLSQIHIANLNLLINRVV